MLCNFIEIALRHGCSSVNLLHISRTPFLKNTSEEWLLTIRNCKSSWIRKNDFGENISLFDGPDLSLYPLKIEIRRFSIVFSGYREKPEA